MTDKHDQDGNIESEAQYVGMRGWLLFYAILLSVNALFACIGSIRILMRLDELVIESGWLALFIMFGIFMNLWILLATIKFFRKDRDAPTFIINWILTLCGGSAAACLVAGIADDNMLLMVGAVQFVKSIIAALIWIPYLMMSKRVRATFVNPSSIA